MRLPQSFENIAVYEFTSAIWLSFDEGIAYATLQSAIRREFSQMKFLKQLDGVLRQLERAMGLAV